MSTVNSIRQQHRDGRSIADIAKTNGVSRDTVYKYLRQDDFSPEVPAKRAMASKLDSYKPVIRQWLEDDAKNWRKQRHTARRIWQRFRDECGIKNVYRGIFERAEAGPWKRATRVVCEFRIF